MRYKKELQARSADPVGSRGWAWEVEPRNGGIPGAAPQDAAALRLCFPGSPDRGFRFAPPTAPRRVGAPPLRVVCVLSAGKPYPLETRAGIPVSNSQVVTATVGWPSVARLVRSRQTPGWQPGGRSGPVAQPTGAGRVPA